MAESIGKMALMVTANITGLQAGLAHGKRDIDSFANSTKSSMKSMVGNLGSDFMKFGKSPLGIVGALGTAYAGYVAHVASEMNELADEAQRLGIGVEALQGYENAAKKAGVEITDVGTAMNKLEKLSAEAQAGVGESAEKFRELGISIKSVSGLAPDKLFETTARHIMSIQDHTTRARAEMELFGKSGARLEEALRHIAAGRTGFVIPEGVVDKYNRIAESSAALYENGKGALKVLASMPLEPVALLLGGLANVFAPSHLNVAGLKDAKQSMQDMAVIAERIRKEKEEEAAITKRMQAGYDMMNRLNEQNTGKPEWMVAYEKWAKDATELNEAQKDNIGKQITEAGTLADLRKRDMDDMKRAHQEVEAAIQASKTAEEEFAEATRRAHDWAQRGVITLQQEAALIGQSQQKLKDTFGKELAQTKLPDLVVKGSQEEYKSLAAYQAQLAGQKTQDERLAALLAATERGNNILQAIADKADATVVANTEG